MSKKIFVCPKCDFISGITRIRKRRGKWQLLQKAITVNDYGELFLVITGNTYGEYLLVVCTGNTYC